MSNFALQQMRTLQRTCERRYGITVEERVINIIRLSSSLVDRLILCNDDELFVDLYRTAERQYSTETRARIRGVGEARNLTLGSVLKTKSFNSSFYNAFDDGMPCVVKFPHCDGYRGDAASAVRAVAHEAASYAQAAQSGHAGVAFLVPVTHVTFELDDSAQVLGRKLVMTDALKTKLYYRSLDSVVRNARMVAVYRMAATSTYAALEALHSVGLVHCDVKPGNMFLAFDGGCALGDYGSVTPAMQGVGATTPAFIPEELQAKYRSGALKATPALDFGMLACSLAWMLNSPARSIDALTAAAASCSAADSAAATSESTSEPTPTSTSTSTLVLISVVPALADVARVIMQCVAHLKGEPQCEAVVPRIMTEEERYVR